MDYIYARVSTDHQSTDHQLLSLTAQQPQAIVIKEVESGVKKRPELDALLEKVVEGDRIFIYALDRFGRSIQDLLRIFDLLEAKKVSIISQREGVLDRSTPTGEFMINMMASLATMERRMLVERINSGLKRAKSEGKKLGRAYTFPESTRAQIRDLRAQGVSLKDIANTTGVSKSQVYEITKNQQ
jgi:DNA invertase Pin-like site-specific DNA recombinase